MNSGTGKYAVTSRYAGSDRRIHKVFVTRNTEYHLRRDTCVAVRDRRSGDWVPAHMAVDKRVQGGLKFHDHGSISANRGIPHVGESLFFYASGSDLVTSTVLAVERPERNIVSSYQP